MVSQRRRAGSFNSNTTNISPNTPFCYGQKLDDFYASSQNDVVLRGDLEIKRGEVLTRLS
jgi:hypothetical protein